MDTSDPTPQKVFYDARRRAFWQTLLSLVSQRPDRLLSWDQVKETLRLHGKTIHRQIETVPLDRIVGSVGRYNDFDRAFLPRHDNLEPRWSSVARAHESGIQLPPINLYRVGEVYFVVDGHHRVSVARSQGIRYLDARVTEIESDVPIDVDLDAHNLAIKGEYARFLQQTQLHELRPDQRLETSAAGGYQRILEQIAMHSCLIEARRGHPISQTEAVAAWYDEVYLPIVDMIREQGILTGFPQRTETDLYLWIVAHQEYLHDQCGTAINTERAAEHYAERYPRRMIQRAAQAAKELVTGLDCDLLAENDENESTEPHPQSQY